MPSLTYAFTDGSVHNLASLWKASNEATAQLSNPTSGLSVLPAKLLDFTALEFYADEANSAAVAIGGADIAIGTNIYSDLLQKGERVQKVRATGAPRFYAANIYLQASAGQIIHIQGEY